MAQAQAQAETAQLISQFFNRIEPPPLSPQSWLDSWTVGGGRSGGSTGSETRSPSGEGSGSSGGSDGRSEPRGAPSGSGESPSQPSGNPEPGGSGDGGAAGPAAGDLAAQHQAMHAWLDAHPYSADQDEGFDAFTLGWAHKGGDPLFAGLSFGETPGMAAVAPVSLRILQGLKEGFTALPLV